MEIQHEIRKLAEEKNAVILAHNYQPGEIQDIADFTGDSLELAKIAAKTDYDIILFCGVYFMAESAKILSPDKTVLIPDEDALCPMAQMASPDKIIKMKEKYPNAEVVTYINSTAETKSESDICCTSSNALKIVEALETNEIIFLPDQNLGSYIAENTSKNIILWDGYCLVHHFRTVNEIIEAKKKHPNALVIMHPECPSDVRKYADQILSTGEMVKYVKDNPQNEYIVATENGMIHKLKTEIPQSQFYNVTDDFICRNMKKITLEKVLNSLKNNTYEVNLDNNIRLKAERSLKRMLELS